MTTHLNKYPIIKDFLKNKLERLILLRPNCKKAEFYYNPYYYGITYNSIEVE